MMDQVSSSAMATNIGPVVSKVERVDSPAKPTPILVCCTCTKPYFLLIVNVLVGKCISFASHIKEHNKSIKLKLRDCPDQLHNAIQFTCFGCNFTCF